MLRVAHGIEDCTLLANKSQMGRLHTLRNESIISCAIIDWRLEHGVCRVQYVCYGGVTPRFIS